MYVVVSTCTLTKVVYREVIVLRFRFNYVLAKSYYGTIMLY